MTAITILPDSTDPRVGTTFTEDGWTVSVETHPDDESSTADADCYTQSQIAEYHAGDWTFVGCVVTASREGIELGTASLWGLESGWFTYTDEDDTVTARGHVGPYVEAVDDLIREAIAEGSETLTRLCASR